MFSLSLEKLITKKKEEFSFRQLVERVFFDDWPMKLIALLITVALWLGITGLGKPTEDRLRGVELKLRVSSEMELTKSPVKEVELVLFGDIRKIDQIRREDLVIIVDLSGSGAGERSVLLTPESVNVQLPTGVKLKEIVPSKIDVTLEMIESREIEIKAETVNSVPDGYEVYGISVIPQKVPAIGPSSFINSINYVSTEKIDLKGREGDFTARQIPLNMSNPRVTVTDQTTVDVFLRIGEKRIERLFLIPLKERGENRTATIVLFGARSLVNSVSAQDLNVKLVKTESNKESLSLSLPAEIQGKVEIRKSQINGK